MKVYLKRKRKGWGIDRVIHNLEKYMPDNMESVDDPLEADLILMHINGRHDHRIAEAEQILERGQKYAVLQYVLKSCRNPDPNDWTWLWDNSKVMWSYYDLRDYCQNMYFAPLAADKEIFYKEDGVEKEYMVGTLGGPYNDECYLEPRMASFHAIGKCVHIGTTTHTDPHMTLLQDISDDELRHVYNQCKWFSVLRRKDGFEMPIVESLLCGTMPIVFDAPNYKTWFNGLVHYIPEDSPGNIVRTLKKLLLTDPPEVDIEEVKRRFDWETIIKGFWERCTT